MKILRTQPSNQGHQKIDYILSVSELEMTVLKKLLLYTKIIDADSFGNELKCAHISIRQTLGKLGNETPDSGKTKVTHRPKKLL